jgi:hypothetical protein
MVDACDLLISVKNAGTFHLIDEQKIINLYTEITSNLSAKHLNNFYNCRNISLVNSMIIRFHESWSNLLMTLRLCFPFFLFQGWEHTKDSFLFSLNEFVFNIEGKYDHKPFQDKYNVFKALLSFIPNPKSTSWRIERNSLGIDGSTAESLYRSWSFFYNKVNNHDLNLLNYLFSILIIVLLYFSIWNLFFPI